MDFGLKVVRIAKGANSTLSHLYANGVFLNYLLEDKLSTTKTAGLTCIPEGEYTLMRNTTAGMNTRYRERFPKMHRGMLQICGIPDFDLVFLHIGNTHLDTHGCPLTGTYWQKRGDDFEVCQSEAAYRYVYPLLDKLLEAGEIKLKVENKTAAPWNSLF
ncbi:hypothetical protein BCY91_12705 [Pelobium manganitolerans]|uniref:DUF5675 domain-containing protein n=1 Tax=Pelobium manganitolerans TaxID=1842495 RepID=A0A419S1X6_9SPHI|nr:DUF5675 family protein [Pelobium manganitolerans]RKD12498.1 hypothetical protein BCY91_12705 [Pelobium manganitolerans]